MVHSGMRQGARLARVLMRPGGTGCRRGRSWPRPPGQETGSGEPRSSKLQRGQNAGQPPRDAVLEPSTIGIVGKLLRFVAKYGLHELDISTGQLRVQIRRRSALSRHLRAKPKASATQRLVHIASPLAGVFYGRPAPDARPYVEVGQWVEPGQAVALVEAMKVFNEITSDRAGRVSQIFVDDAQLVEADQPLMALEVGGEPP